MATECCSFCGASAARTGHLIVRPNGVAICPTCVLGCLAIYADTQAALLVELLDRLLEREDRRPAWRGWETVATGIH
jgi:hypothetical protein